MNVSPANGASAAAMDAVRQNAAPDAATAASADFQTFLQLLVAQMRNQDPMKPIESTDFVAQLATFSGVEQQVRANEKLDLIFTALMGGGASAAGLAEWIGREVRAPVAANFAGVPVEVDLPKNPQADGAFIVVRNAFDQVVLRRPIDPGQSQFVWDGLTTGGDSAAHGSYRFEVEAYRNDALLGTEKGWVFARVTEVRIDEGVAKLMFQNGEMTPVSAITGVR